MSAVIFLPCLNLGDAKHRFNAIRWYKNGTGIVVTPIESNSTSSGVVVFVREHFPVWQMSGMFFVDRNYRPCEFQPFT